MGFHCIGFLFTANHVRVYVRTTLALDTVVVHKHTRYPINLKDF